jgi:hypothetical protein
MRALCCAPAISGLTNDYVMVAHIGVRAAIIRSSTVLFPVCCEHRADFVGKAWFDPNETSSGALLSGCQTALILLETRSSHAEVQIML